MEIGYCFLTDLKDYEDLHTACIYSLYRPIYVCACVRACVFACVKFVCVCVCVCARARCVTSAHATACSTAVDNNNNNNNNSSNSPVWVLSIFRSFLI